MTRPVGALVGVAIALHADPARTRAVITASIDFIGHSLRPRSPDRLCKSGAWLPSWNDSGSGYQQVPPRATDAGRG